MGPFGPTPVPRAAKLFKIVLASWSEFPYSTSSHGGVAQLGERLTGSQEVRGSIPLVSTIVNARPLERVAFLIFELPNKLHAKKLCNNLLII